MAVIFQDDFNRPDSTDLGTDWQEVGGDFAIVSNQLHIGTYSAPVQCVYTTQISTPDYAVQAFCHTGLNPKRTPGVFLRGVWNATSLRYDCYYAYVDERNQLVRLYLYQNGSYTEIANVSDTSIDTTGATGYTVRLEAEGTTLRVYVDGVLKITATDSTLTAGGYAGVMAGSVRTSIYWDDFLVEDLAAGGTVYTEDVGYTQFNVVGGADLQTYVEKNGFVQIHAFGETDRQRYVERASFFQLVTSQIADLQQYIERLAGVQSQSITPGDLQRYIDLISYLQTAGLTVADLQRYVERLDFTQLSAVSIVDLQRYVERLADVTVEVFATTDVLVGKLAEYLSMVQTQIINGTDRQRYIENRQFVQSGLQTVTDLQRYVAELRFIQSQLSAISDLQRYVENILAAMVSDAVANDLQQYVETLESVTAEIIAVAEKYAGVVSEQLSIIQSGAFFISDIQRYIEQLAFATAQLFTGAEFQQFIEQLQFGGNLLVSETDLQRYVEKINTNLNQILVSTDLQQYIEALGFTGVEPVSIVDIYFSRTPVKPVFVALKLLQMVFEMRERQTEFQYVGHRRNYFNYDGKPELKPIKQTTEKYTILSSPDDAGQMDSANNSSITTVGVYEYIEAFSNGVYRSAMIFRSIGVANGLDLKKATLRMYLHDIDDRLGNLHLRAQIGDNIPDFTEQDINTRTGAVAEYDIPLSGLVAGQWHEFDVTTFLETVFSNPSWKPGFDLCLILEPPAGVTVGYTFWHSFDNSSGNVPELIIDYYETAVYPIRRGELDAYSVSDSSGACSYVVNNSPTLIYAPSSYSGRNVQFAVELDQFVPNPVSKAELWLYIQSYQKLENFNYIYLLARKKCSNAGYFDCSDFDVQPDWSDVFIGAGEYVDNYLDLVKSVDPPGWVRVDITNMLNLVMGQSCWGVNGYTISFLFAASSSDAGEQIIYRAFEYDTEHKYTPFIKVYK